LREVLEDGYQLAVGPVADGVDGYGQPGLIGLAHGLGDLCHRRQGHAALARIFVGLQHPGRASALAAVGKELDVPHAQTVVAEAGAQPQSDGLVQSLAGDAHPQPQGQLACCLQALIGPKGWLPLGSAHASMVVDAGQAQTVEKGKSLPHGFDGFFFGGRGNDVSYQGDRPFAQHAGWLPRLVPVNDALGRIGRVTSDARFPERPRVDHGQVHVAAPHDDGVSGGHIVQIGPVGDAWIEPAGLVPALAQDPVTERRLICSLSQPLSQVGQRGRVCQGQLPQAKRPLVEVKVGIGQAGQRQPAAQVNQPGVGSSQRPHLGIVPDSQKTAIADSDGGSRG